MFNSAVAGGTFSNVSTLILLAILLAAIEPTLLRPFIIPLILASAVICIYGAYFIKKITLATPLIHSNKDSAFNLYQAASFAFLMTIILFVSAVVNAQIGEKGVLISALFTGMFDAHATAASIASLVHSQKLTVTQALLPILLAVSSNTITKVVVAFKAGGMAYAIRISIGLFLMIGCCFLALLAFSL